MNSKKSFFSLFAEKKHKSSNNKGLVYLLARPRWLLTLVEDLKNHIRSTILGIDLSITTSLEQKCCLVVSVNLSELPMIAMNHRKAAMGI